MKCVLMNKNTEVLVLEYDSITKGFNELYEIKNIEYAPFNLYKNYINNNDIKRLLEKLTEWFKGRGIPSWRDDLDLLLSKLDIDSPAELLDKAFGLSLSDQYWIKPFNSNILYKDINFFDHDFKDSEFVDITFSNNINNCNVSLISPNNTTDGRLKKTWVIDNNKRYLLKGAYKNEIMQPFNEVLASMICKRLGFYHIPYTISIVNNKIVSKCECFVDSNTELVTAHQILSGISNKDKAYEEYISILSRNGIDNVRESLENMFILDYIILNEDRHLNNFGIIRNVDSLKWERVAPIFDSGQSLNIVDFNDDEVIINGDGRFFYSVLNFEDILNHMTNLNRIDLSKLDGLCEEFDELLHKYQSITNMTDRRINKICTLLYSRISKLKRRINK